MELSLQHNVRLDGLNSLAVPCVADNLLEFHHADQLAAVLHQVERFGGARVMGSASNLVLPERLSHLLIAMRASGRELLAADGDAVRLRAAAGENWHALVQWCVQQGYYGLENLALIPGTVGAAPVQNIGAYGVELSELIESVDYVDFASGSRRVLMAQDCDFSYRNSRFKAELLDRGMITAVTFRLSRKPRLQIDYPTLRQALPAGNTQLTPQVVFDTVCRVRRERLPDPVALPNVGSFFHNPVISAQQCQELQQRWPDIPVWPATEGCKKIPAGWLIEQLGWKQREYQGVRVAPAHALVVINPHHRSGADVLAFARQICDSVTAEFGIHLHIEPRVWAD